MKTKLMMALFLVCVSTQPVLAEVTVEYLGPLDVWPQVEAPLSTDCIIGNTNNPAYIVPEDVFSSLFLGSTFNPNLFGCDCELGFQVEAYHFIVAKTGDSPAEMSGFLSLGDSYLLPDDPPWPECYVPSIGPNYSYGMYCFGNDIQLTLSNPGFYKISLTDIYDCGCVLATYAHTFTFSFLQTYEIHLVTSDDPGHCPDFLGDPSMGQIWWSEIDAPGNFVLWADVNCYHIPVATEKSVWNNIKAFYR